MNSNELVECVQCTLHHQCPVLKDKQQQCAYCKIKYPFVACRPILLQCQHHVCAQCIENIKNLPSFCHICNSKIKSSYILNKSTELLVKNNLNLLNENLKKHLNDSFTLLKGKILN